jgi:hypothetical protein
MKKLTLHFILASILTTLLSTTSAHADLSSFLEKKNLKGKLSEELANVDVGASLSLGDIDLIKGINIGLKERYEVEASYLDQYYIRVDKYDLKQDIKVGDLVENFVDLPFTFSVNHQNSFQFVRQFKSKKEALKALPYSPKRLPITADRALKNMNIGDFVSMPATLSILTELRAKSATVAPVIISANAGVYMIVSGEFTVQIFKLDDTHVRVKILSNRNVSGGTNGGVGLSFDVFGFRVLDKQLERLVDRDFVQYGYEAKLGEQFIVDYVFDLNNSESKDAYNQILNSSVKFKDGVVANQLKKASTLKDKLISSFEKAETLFETDKNKAPKERRVSRIFKGFNKFKGDVKKLKLAFLVASFKKDNAYTENNVTMTDKNENELEYFYPTNSRYLETRMGKFIFDLKDQNFQNNFGLIPRIKNEDAKNKDPDYGLSYERRDKRFSPAEQRFVQRFLLGQMPEQFKDQIKLGTWEENVMKQDSKITFQLILKSQGFNVLREYSREDLKIRLLAYVTERKKLTAIAKADTKLQKLKNFLHINITDTKRINELGDDLYTILKNEEKDSIGMLRKMVKLTQDGLFDKIGVGFLISLLPEESLKNLIYIKLNVTAKDSEEVNYEFGRPNYAVLYKELEKVQTRISAQTYDLRLSDEDHQMENEEISNDKTRLEVLTEDSMALNEAI